MFDYSGQFVSPTTTARGQLLINSVTLYAYDAADVMDDINYATVLNSSLQVPQVNTKRVSGLDHLVPTKKWGISPKKALNTICHTTHCVASIFVWVI